MLLGRNCPRLTKLEAADSEELSLNYTHHNFAFELTQKVKKVKGAYTSS